jgi:ATP-dependent RNA helicase DeaD
MSAVVEPAGPVSPSFRELALSEPVLQALADVGYESPSPIQAATIPVLLSGVDMLGQAQTGTGKTAAFALPALTKIDLSRHEPQVLVLVPTRELALQVAEAFQRYAAHLKGFHVLPIYGGQSYQPQLNALRRGVHVVVGTPGRVIDHMDRGTLKLSGLTLLVLDEADEMLQMGFVDAVESILEKTPPQRQVALFSATLAAPIRRIAQKHLRSPVEVTIKSKTSTATNIRQRYWVVSGVHKLDALTRILEAEPFDGMLVFTRTKQSTVELAEKLEARGFAAAPLNGDIPQALRERTVARLKSGQIDIVVATDVAARGLDVERIGHVVNYDVPYDTESYVHRIGRTGRAGRNGEAILFIAPRERNMLRAIERATRQTIEQMNLPSVDAVNAKRIAKFKLRVAEALAKPDAGAYRAVIEQLEAESGTPLIDIAAALASLAQGATPLLLAGKPEPRLEAPPPAPAPAARPIAEPRPIAAARADAEPSDVASGERSAEPPNRLRKHAMAAQMETYRLEVGATHGIKPGNIVGAIANEAGIEGVHIGRVDIREEHSYVDLPEGMPKNIFKALQKVRVAGRELRISRVTEKPPKPPRDPAGRHKERKLLTRR